MILMYHRNCNGQDLNLLAINRADLKIYQILLTAVEGPAASKAAGCLSLFVNSLALESPAENAAEARCHSMHPFSVRPMGPAPGRVGPCEDHAEYHYRPMRAGAV